ncbi:hypothetical protein [Curtobacterium sp. PhB115]|uniref:hypothetical protein n=1 Tax=Curtobacterium sp. PhB115 TaxID=2485173 RepID=UPI000F4C36EC|nr:hypothetical protein [Curtobacterium sp. PhB115]ROP74010.1 hypothetical protein EDF19_0083 [Curtobacterium sp. PhB115]
MRHVPALLLPALAGVCLLAGCASAAPPVDEDALHDWKSAQDAAVETEADVLGVLQGDIGPGNDLSDAEPTVTLQFPASQYLDHLEFSCYGNGQMRGQVRTVTERGAQSVELDEMACNDSPHRITLSRSARDAVDSVAFTGTDSDRSSAWRLVIVGPGPSGD